MFFISKKRATMAIITSLVSMLLLGTSVQAKTTIIPETLKVLKVSDIENTQTFVKKVDSSFGYSIANSSAAIDLIEQKAVDAIVVNEKELKNLKELVNKQFKQKGYVLIYNQEGTLSPENVYNELGLNYAKASENDIAWKQIGLGIYNRSDGVRVVHGLYSKENKDISQSESELNEILLKDIKGDRSSQQIANVSTESLVTLAGTPGPWSNSSTYYNAPYGKVTITRDYNPVRVNNNTKTAWAIHTYVMTSPGILLSKSDSSYGYDYVTDDMTFKIAKFGSYEEITQASPNSTSSSSTASVSLSYPGAISVGWNFASSGVQITNQSSLPSYGQWYEYFTGNTKSTSYSSQPGVVATNTAGDFRIDYTMYLDWQDIRLQYYYPLNATPVDFIPDF